MKKLIAVILTLVLLIGCCAAAEDVEVTVSKYEKLTVGVTTAFSGNFLADALGSNISDQDIRKIIHSYSLVKWDSDDGVFKANDQVITSTLTNADKDTYILSISRNLTYSDGTPITAKDYAFSFLLLTSSQLLEAGGLRQEGSQVKGWDAYDQHRASTVTGFRLMGDYQLSITIAKEYTPYFYQLKTLDIFPLPMSVIAPGCDVRDDGNGIFMTGNFTADLLKQTVLDPDTGYAAHPSVTSGPYKMTAYDGKTVWLELNDKYIGDAEGKMPEISSLVVRYVPSRDIMARLIVGDIDLAVRCSRTDMVSTGMALFRTGGFKQKSYSRNGLGFISFCGEDGPTAEAEVRKALAMCVDKVGLNAAYMGNMGTTVDGYYGIGQWMFPMTRGMIPDSWIEEADEDETWEDITLDGLTKYELDPTGAAELLSQAGWNLNEDGGEYTGGIRYKRVKNELVPLKLKLIYPNDNLAGPLLEEYFVPYLREAGGEVEITSASMPALLEKYYATDNRDCDMIMLGSNFQDVFDPSVYYDENGKDRLNGITDEQLAELARNMRRTDPDAPAEYVRRWIRYLERRSEVLPEIPLYSNAYLDFFREFLREYYPGDYSAWSEALVYAYLGDEIEEEEEEGEDEFGDEDDEESMGFDD